MGTEGPPKCLSLCVLSCFRHVRLCATLRTVARQASLFMGFSKKEYWSGLPCPPPGDLPNPRIKPASLMSPALAGRPILYCCEKERKKESEAAQLCLTLCDPMDCSLPGSSVHGIFQARILEWVAIAFSRGSSQPRAQTQVSHIAYRFLPAEPPGKSKNTAVSSLSLLQWILLT